MVWVNPLRFLVLPESRIYSSQSQFQTTKCLFLSIFPSFPTSSFPVYLLGSGEGISRREGRVFSDTLVSSLLPYSLPLGQLSKCLQYAVVLLGPICGSSDASHGTFCTASFLIWVTSFGSCLQLLPPVPSQCLFLLLLWQVASGAFQMAPVLITRPASITPQGTHLTVPWLE